MVSADALTLPLLLYVNVGRPFETSTLENRIPFYQGNTTRHPNFSLVVFLAWLLKQTTDDVVHVAVVEVEGEEVEVLKLERATLTCGIHSGRR